MFKKTCLFACLSALLLSCETDLPAEPNPGAAASASGGMQLAENPATSAATVSKKKKSKRRRARKRLKPRPAPKRWAVGLGYPDLRLRYAALTSLDVEAKFAYLPGIQVYTARLYWNFYDVGPLNLIAAAEGGYGHFEGIEMLTGDAWIGGASVGVEYPFARVMRLSVDFGPAYIAANAAGVNLNSLDYIANTALYYHF